jgi:hypothetical protein
MSTKITTPELFNLSSNNTEATQLPVFTTSTRPTPTASTVQVEYLVVAGGGAGGGFYRGGGGGAGELKESASSIALSTGSSYDVVVGAGGAGVIVSSDNGSNGNNGDNSTFYNITSLGGGGGSPGDGSSGNTGSNGGSGGGAGGNWGGAAANGGSATGTGLGNNGGAGGPGSSTWQCGGGGGGATQAGFNAGTSGTAGDGGAGKTYTAATSITGQAFSIAGGGGGGNYSSGNITVGGIGGGAAGASGSPYTSGPSGTNNTGGGGGGGNGTSPQGAGGDGGSGIVILRYPTNSSPVIKTTGSLVYTESIDGSDTVIQFTEGSGNVSFASAGIAVGEMIFNSTTEKVEYWDGFQWNMIKDEAVAPSIEPNQILWLDANNANSWTGSGSTWFDVSGNGYDATITTAVPSTGTVNGATYLNIPSSSRADYFKIPYSTHSGALNMNSSSVITWLYWMRLPNIPTSVNGLNVVLKSTATGATQNQVYFRYYDPSIEGFNTILYDANYNAAINPGYIAPVNNTDWFMFVAIFNFPANNFQFHRYQPNTTTYNNTALGNVSPQNTNNNDIYLLSEPASIYGGYGELGEIRAYNTTFTISEITAKYNAQKGKYGIT